MTDQRSSCSPSRTLIVVFLVGQRYFIEGIATSGSTGR
jgi:hypothetical protein